MSSTATLSARARIEALVDANSFVEIGALVKKRNTDYNMQEKEVPADGVITGYGVIDSNLVYVYSQDVTAMKGSIGEMHAKKIVGLYDMAIKVGAPIIGLIDCAGLRLQEATDALASFGEIYRSQVKASGVIPQISAILGSCGGGVGVLAALSDFTFMEENNGKLFINSPNSIIGNRADLVDTSSAKFQSQSGMVDFVFEGEEVILTNLRTLVTMLPSNNENDSYQEDSKDDMNRIIDDFESMIADPTIGLSFIADGNLFIETKKDFGKDMVTGLMVLNGVTVGVVANRTSLVDEDGKETESFPGVLTTDGCKKAERLVKFCDAFSLPVITLTNVSGYASSMEEEKTIGVAVAKLTYAFASADVPKINVIVGNALGSAYLSMNSKHIGADLVFALESAKVGVMDSMTAARIIYEDEIASKEDKKEALENTAKEIEEQNGSATAAAERGYVDAIIESSDIRKHLIYSVEMLYSKKDVAPSKKHGTV